MNTEPDITIDVMPEKVAKPSKTNTKWSLKNRTMDVHKHNADEFSISNESITDFLFDVPCLSDQLSTKNGIFFLTIIIYKMFIYHGLKK